MSQLSALLREHARSDTAANREPGCAGMNGMPKDHLSWQAADVLDALERTLGAIRDTVDRALAELRSDKP